MCAYRTFDTLSPNTLYHTTVFNAVNHADASFLLLVLIFDSRVKWFMCLSFPTRETLFIFIRHVNLQRRCIFFFLLRISHLPPPHLTTTRYCFQRYKYGDVFISESVADTSDILIRPSLVLTWKEDDDVGYRKVRTQVAHKDETSFTETHKGRVGAIVHSVPPPSLLSVRRPPHTVCVR